MALLLPVPTLGCGGYRRGAGAETAVEDLNLRACSTLGDEGIGAAGALLVGHQLPDLFLHLRQGPHGGHTAVGQPQDVNAVFGLDEIRDVPGLLLLEGGRPHGGRKRAAVARDVAGIAALLSRWRIDRIRGFKVNQCGSSVSIDTGAIHANADSSRAIDWRDSRHALAGPTGRIERRWRSCPGGRSG
jgi:hypothetical protein